MYVYMYTYISSKSDCSGALSSTRSMSWQKDLLLCAHKPNLLRASSRRGKIPQKNKHTTQQNHLEKMKLFLCSM